MISNTFEFVGKITPCKETESFHPYENIRFPDSDWGKKSIKFNVKCGNNRHLVEVSQLVNAKNPDSMTIYTFTKGNTSSDGAKTKGEKLEISFKDRFKQEIIDKVAEYKKFIIDTELPSRRFHLEKAINKFKNGTITDEQMGLLGVHSIEECEQAFEDSKKKKHEFISAYDFIDYLNKFVNSDKIKNMNFKITGTYDVEYDRKNDKWYRHFNVQRIYRQNDDVDPISQATFGIVFGREAIRNDNFEETKKASIDCYIAQYLNNFKKSFFCPLKLVIDGNGDEKAYKKAVGFVKKFEFPDTTDCDYREIGVVCTVLNGAQEVEITEDMLTDEQRENLEYGLITIEDIKAELGKAVFGDRVTDIVINKLSRNYSKGAVDTAFTDKDFCKPHIETPKTDNAETLETDDEADTFDEDIDI